MSWDDAPGRAFEAARPLGPGQRGLDARCRGCGARFRVVAEGGAIDRDGALEYRLLHVNELDASAAPMDAARDVAGEGR